MVIAGFLVQDKLENIWYFEMTFLLAVTNIEVVLKMSFFTFSDANIRFVEKELEWRRYLTAEALPTTQRVELIDKSEIAFATLDENADTLVIYIAILSVPTI